MDSENTIDLKNLPEKPQEPYVETTASGIPNVIAWEARHTLPEHARWKHLIALILIVSAGLAIAWWQGNWMVFIVASLGALAWEIHERHSAPVRVHMDDAGVTIDGMHLPYVDLVSYDIHEFPDGAHEISFATSRQFMPRVRVPLAGHSPESVRDFLSLSVPREKHITPILEAFLRKR